MKGGYGKGNKMNVQSGGYMKGGKMPHASNYKTGGPVRQHYKLATTGNLGQDGGKINGGKMTPA